MQMGRPFPVNLQVVVLAQVPELPVFDTAELQVVVQVLPALAVLLALGTVVVAVVAVVYPA